MTEVARIVLQDLKHAIANHTDELHSEEFRVSWFSIVALLRSIGHVLDKVDANKSQMMRRAVDDKWKELSSSKPEPLIFWGFIEAERNRFLKNYEHGIERAVTARSLGGKIITVTNVSNSRGGYLSGGTEVHSVTSNGPFSGQNEKDVAWQGYAWWRKYLDEVDQLAIFYEKP
jgi:hypothetical protein